MEQNYGEIGGRVLPRGIFVCVVGPNIKLIAWDGSLGCPIGASHLVPVGFIVTITSIGLLFPCCVEFIFSNGRSLPTGSL